eukprot:814844-Amphidinium_carterae.2
MHWEGCLRRLHQNGKIISGGWRRSSRSTERVQGPACGFEAAMSFEIPTMACKEQINIAADAFSGRWPQQSTQLLWECLNGGVSKVAAAPAVSFPSLFLSHAVEVDAVILVRWSKGSDIFQAAKDWRRVPAETSKDQTPRDEEKIPFEGPRVPPAHLQDLALLASVPKVPGLGFGIAWPVRFGGKRDANAVVTRQVDVGGVAWS